jgi:hypothetical protein
VNQSSRIPAYEIPENEDERKQGGIAIEEDANGLRHTGRGQEVSRLFPPLIPYFLSQDWDIKRTSASGTLRQNASEHTDNSKNKNEVYRRTSG